jgi:hypothetical protein
MNDNNVQDPGFLEVMQNMSVSSPSPFRSYAKIGQTAAEAGDGPSDTDGLTLVFEKDVAVDLKARALKYGFDNAPGFIQAAVSVFGQMLAAAQDDGYTQVILLNPKTEEVIQVAMPGAQED